MGTDVRVDLIIPLGKNQKVSVRVVTVSPPGAGETRLLEVFVGADVGWKIREGFDAS